MAGALEFEGLPIGPLTQLIAIQSGWNWIGYLPQVAKSVNDAISSINPVENDYIKNQTASSTFYDGFGWFGELTDLEPLDGYMLKSSTGGTLTYPEPSSGTFTDIRDSKTYKWLKIGEQTWMAENLAYLPTVSPSAEGSETDPYYYVHGYEGSTNSEAEETANYATYGVLYNWPAALTACPTGWHLPTDEEWKVLEKNQGMTNSDADATGWRNSGTVGGKLKETGASHWYSPNTGATNSSGFTALPGGCRGHTGGLAGLGYYTVFWSATEGGSLACYRSLGCDRDGVDRVFWYCGYSISVRCLQNN